MQMLRVVLRDDVLVDDAAAVLRSMDQLAKIMVWVASEGDRTYFRTGTRGRTWRVVNGLRIARVQEGSEIVDLIPSIEKAVSALAAGGYLVTLFRIGERVLKDRSHRLTMNSIAEVSAYQDLAHKRAMNAYDLAERRIALDERTQRSGEQRSELARVARVTDWRAELEDVRQDASALGIREDLDASILGLTPKEARSRDPDPMVVRAYSDATVAVGRMDRAQRRGEPVKDILLIDDDIS